MATIEQVLAFIDHAPAPAEAYSVERVAARAALPTEQVQAFLSPWRRFELTGQHELGFATGVRGEHQVVVGLSQATIESDDGPERLVELVLFDTEGSPVGGESLRVQENLSLSALLPMLEVTAATVSIQAFAHPRQDFFALVPFDDVAHGVAMDGVGEPGALREWIETGSALFVWESTELRVTS